MEISERSPRPKIERIVFGYGIGKTCRYKSPAEVFVEKLYDYYMGYDKKAYGEQEANQRFNNLIATWKQDPNLTDAERKSMLGVAYVIARNKKSCSILDAEAYKKEYNSWELVKIGIEPAQEYTISRIAAGYSKVANFIERLIKQEKALAQGGRKL